jgi:hypothetical protein
MVLFNHVKEDLKFFDKTDSLLAPISNFLLATNDKAWLEGAYFYKDKNRGNGSAVLEKLLAELMRFVTYCTHQRMPNCIQLVVSPSKWGRCELEINSVPFLCQVKSESGQSEFCWDFFLGRQAAPHDWLTLQASI